MKIDNNNAGELILGIDCGTTYTKYSAIDVNGVEIFGGKIKSVEFISATFHHSTYAAEIWTLVDEIVKRSLAYATSIQMNVCAIALCAVSPVILAFDSKNPNYTQALPYWRYMELDEQFHGLEMTSNRIKYLKKVVVAQAFVEPVFCDLIGYLNFRLCGNLSLNTVTAGELGLKHCSNPMLPHAEFPCLPKIIPPAEKCGVTHLVANGLQYSLHVFAGGPDSLGACLASGTLEKDQQLIYLGTFGSLLTTDRNIIEVTRRGNEPSLPYRWILSVPNFGTEVECRANNLFGNLPSAAALAEMDKAAASSPPGSGKSVFHLPFWDDNGNTLGSFGFENSLDILLLGRDVQARAILESIGHAVICRAFPKVARVKSIGLCGGGARSKIWQSILADLIGIDLRVSVNQPYALGAACIAAIGFEINIEKWPITELVNPIHENHMLARQSTGQAYKYYKAT